VKGQYGCEVQSSFFTFEGEPYRVFLAKAKYERQSFENPEVYVSIEYLGKNSSNMLSDSGVCDQAVRLVFSASGKHWKWSEDPEVAHWVEEAKKRGLDCGVSGATQSDTSVQVDKEVAVAVEQPENARTDSLSDDDLCDKAIRLVFSSTGRAWKWSEEIDAVKWVDEAKERGLDCGVAGSPLKEGATVSDGVVDGIEPLALSDEELCKNSIELVSDNGVSSWKWTKDATSTKWVEQAKQRGLGCGVSNLTNGAEVADDEFRSASDSDVCSAAKRLFFTSNGTQWKWSEETEAAAWVSEAQKRQLDCGIQQ
jgi:hypothetical protein